ncbi:MAG TPA: BLUF domain-containing protein [Pirellulales bacterium]
MLIELMYSSVATRLLVPGEVVQLLEHARRKNALAGITGILLYSRRTGEFLQLIEGPSRAIETLMTTIRRDERHERIEVLCRNPITQRGFQDWSMAFQPFDGLDPNQVGGGVSVEPDDAPSDDRICQAVRVMKQLRTLHQPQDCG